MVAAFNAGVSFSATAFSGMAFHAIVPELSTELLEVRPLLGGVAAGVVLHLVNLGAMAGMVSLRKGLTFWSVWTKTWTVDAVQSAGVIVLGYLGAVLVQQAWWSVLLLIVPLVLAHQALSRRVKEATANIELAEKLEAQMVELKATQAQLVQSAKMASIGTLAAGVAHEINNPLFVMMGRAELLLKNHERHLRSERARQYLVTIQEQGARAAQIVKDLLAFSRDSSSIEETSVTDVLDKSAAFAAKVFTAKSNVQIRREYAADLPLTRAAPNKLQQVFINLLQNAKDAMPEGGTIYLRCWTEGDKICASVKDTGQGMTKEVQARVFEPFYTTKEVGQGTGLGLFICHRIISDYHGNIRIESEPGKGTEVVVELPATAARSAEKREAAEAAEAGV
jgi:signal transduction histidine kinase